MIKKYLQQYAVAESTRVARLIKSLQQPGWDAVLVIPAYAESYSSLVKVTQLIRQGGQSLPQEAKGPVVDRLLQIWVINAPDNAPEELLLLTQECWDQCLAASQTICAEQHDYLQRFAFGEVLLLDRFSAGLRLPAKQGVGLARKIGGDCALALFELGLLRQSWLWYTDADAVLPEDYFGQVSQTPASAAAVLYRHQHVLEGELDQQAAMRLYQAKLDLHVAALERAGSPYAYHSIGSTIACHFEGYVKVRGMPCRSGGEDFYLLNKLAKVGNVVSLKGNPILLSGRVSPRVPFGTGPALKAALSRHSDNAGTEITGNEVSGAAMGIETYHPLIYDLLHEIMLSLPIFWELRECPEHALDAMIRAQGACLQKYQERHSGDLCGQAVGEIDLECLMGKWTASVELLSHVKQMLAKSRDEAAFCRHFHCWFDAFKTLKFIHWWRDQGLHSQPVDLLQTQRECVKSEVDLVADNRHLNA